MFAGPALTCGKVDGANFLRPVALSLVAVVARSDNGVVAGAHVAHPGPAATDRLEVEVVPCLPAVVAALDVDSTVVRVRVSAAVLKRFGAEITSGKSDRERAAAW